MLSEICLFRMLVEHPVALARADKNLKKDILGSPTDIQRIGPMSEIDIFWTSTGLTCVMWVTSIDNVIICNSACRFLSNRDEPSFLSSFLKRLITGVNHLRENWWIWICLFQVTPTMGILYKYSLALQNKEVTAAISDEKKINFYSVSIQSTGPTVTGVK